MSQRTVGRRRRIRRETSSVLRWMLPLTLLVMLVEAVIVARTLDLGLPWTRSAAEPRSQATVEPRPTAVGATDKAPAIALTVPPTLAPPTPAPAAQAPSGEAPAPEEAAPAQAIVPGQPAAAPAQPPAVANAQPAGAGASEAAGSGPAATIAQFYRLIEQHAYDRAVQLWSQRMRDDYPPAQNIWGRFDQTQQLVVRRADVTALNEAAGRATVSVDLVEVLSSGERRRYVGSWSLVRGGSGWLLDQPSLLPAPLNG